MDRKMLFSMLMIGLVSMLGGSGLYSLFNDTETSEGNTFTAGTLDLKVDGDDYVYTITLSNLKPGFNSGYYKWVLKNAGTLPGKVSVTFSVIINNENDVEEPEENAEAQWYASSEGELGQYLKPGVHPVSYTHLTLPTN